MIYGIPNVLNTTENRNSKRFNHYPAPLISTFGEKPQTSSICNYSISIGFQNFMPITMSQIIDAILITNVPKTVIYMSGKAELKLMTIKSIIPIILT